MPVMIEGVQDVYYNVRDMRQAGVRFLGDVATAEWGSVVALEDPDGNVLKLMQPAQR